MFYVSSEVHVNMFISGDTCFDVSSEVLVNLFMSGDTCVMSLQRYMSTCRLGVATETYGAESRLTKELPYSRYPQRNIIMKCV